MSESYKIREMRDGDLGVVTALLDAAMGRGFWSLDENGAAVRLVAVSHGRVIGTGAATLGPDPSESLSTPVGHVRLVAVDPQARRQGIGTALLVELSRRCQARGATSLLAYAWVHAPTGVAPLAGALHHAGFSRVRRIEGFYAGITGAPCPVCAQSPCVCPADVYVWGTPRAS